MPTVTPDPFVVTVSAPDPAVRKVARPAPFSVAVSFPTPAQRKVAKPLPFSVAVSAPTPIVYKRPAGGVSGGYQARVVDKTFTLVEDGALKKVTWEGPITLALNEPAAWGFRMPTKDRKLRACVPIAREVQIWRHGRLLTWGPITRKDTGAKTTRVQCRGPEWYFDHRHVGRADRNNLLPNGDWNSTYSPWTVHNTTPVIDTSRWLTGGASLRLEQTTALQEAYMEYVLDDYVATGVGSAITLAGWYYIDPDGWVGESFQSYGVSIRRLHATTGEVLQSDIHEIDGETPKGKWLRFELVVNMPPDAVEDIEVRLWSPGGRIYYDAFSMTLMESVSSVSSADDFTGDVATVMAMLVAHAQDPAFGKSNLNIAVDAPLTGSRIAIHYQMAEHAPIGESLRDFPRQGYPDFWIDNNRTLHTAGPGTLMRRGTYKPEWRATLIQRADGTAVGNVTTAGMGRVFDGEQAVSSATILAQGDGPDREEGGYIDALAYDGTTMEVVEAAAPEAPIDALDRLAYERVQEGKQAESISWEYVKSDMIGELWPGDIVPVLFDYGDFDQTGDWRLQRVIIDPKRDRLAVVATPA